MAHQENGPRSSPSEDSCKEKENTLFSGFKVLTMNSKFITSFKNDYNLPSHIDSSSNQSSRCPGHQFVSKMISKNLKRSLLRCVRLRSHPYENSSSRKACPKSCLKVCNNVHGENSDSSYRLRTTSLSSGTCANRKVRGTRACNILNLSSDERMLDQLDISSANIIRSRSMEDLSSVEASSPLSDKTKDVDNVSIAIQRMKVHDIS